MFLSVSKNWLVARNVVVCVFEENSIHRVRLCIEIHVGIDSKLSSKRIHFRGNPAYILVLFRGWMIRSSTRLLKFMSLMISFNLVAALFPEWWPSEEVPWMFSLVTCLTIGWSNLPSDSLCDHISMVGVLVLLENSLHRWYKHVLLWLCPVTSYSICLMGGRWNVW